MEEYFLVAAAVGTGAFVQGVAGFGSALVSMPLMTLLISVQTAAPVQAVCSMFVSTTVLYFTRESLRWREALLMTAGSFLGLPLGLYLLSLNAPGLVLKLLGAVLVVYALFDLFVAPRLHAREDSELEIHGVWSIAGALFAGALAGVLGGAYATNGPPVVMYGVLRRWPKDTFKSILQAFFLATGFIIIGGHAARGYIDGHVLRLIAFTLPAVFLGIAAGRWVDLRLHPKHFRTAVVVLVLILGISLLLR